MIPLWLTIKGEKSQTIAFLNSAFIFLEFYPNMKAQTNIVSCYYSSLPVQKIILSFFTGAQVEWSQREALVWIYTQLSLTFIIKSKVKVTHFQIPQLPEN